MVDAINGNVLWHAGPTNTTGLGHDSTANFFHPKLTTSIPADIRVIDMTGDGFADRMYTADTGGRVWRFDINNGKSAGTGNGSAPFGSTGTNALVTGGRSPRWASPTPRAPRPPTRASSTSRRTLRW